MGRSVLQPENIPRQVERANLAAPIGEKLVGANRAVCDLVDIVGGFDLPKISVPLLYLNSLGMTLARESSPSCPRAFGRLPGWALTLTNMDRPLFEDNLFASSQGLSAKGLKMDGRSAPGNVLNQTGGGGLLY